MNKQKWLAGLTAVLCSAGALSCFPAISGTVSAAELVSNDFEVNYGGWHGKGRRRSRADVRGGREGRGVNREDRS